MKRNVTLLVSIAGLVTAAVALLSLSHGASPALEHAPARAARAQHAPASAPALAPAPVAVAAPRPTPFDAAHTLDRDEAEQQLALALDRIERTVVSVLEHGDPPPAAHEVRSLREDAVRAYLALAATTSGSDRARRYADVGDAIARLRGLHHAHGDVE
ncbi:MAG: hypothetical protein SFX73_38405 [Kofleriaceae bacterium]|nr:hypothetical protein [Kofleriaceae bacterium]